MSRRAPILLALVALSGFLVATVALGAGNHAADNGLIRITFNPDKSLTVVDVNGNPIGTASGAPTVIPPGTYNLNLFDPSFVADVLFDLSGPGVKVVTSMSSGEEISESLVETFAPSSTYTYRDDNRPGTVWTFVTSATGAPTSQGTTAPATTSSGGQSTGKSGTTTSSDVVGSQTVTYRGTLAGAVSPSGKATLKFKGKPVTTLTSGQYTFAVTDSSSKAGFTVQQKGHSAQTITAVPFKGARSVKVTLGPGQWLFYPSFVAAKTYFLVVKA
jgi:hypothetical protein